MYLRIPLKIDYEIAVLRYYYNLNIVDIEAFYFNHSGLLCWVADWFQLYELHCKLYKCIGQNQGRS